MVLCYFFLFVCSVGGIDDVTTDGTDVTTDGTDDATTDGTEETTVVTEDPPTDDDSTIDTASPGVDIPTTVENHPGKDAYDLFLR